MPASDGSLFRAWLIGLDCTGVPADRERLRTALESLPETHRPVLADPPTSFSISGLQATFKEIEEAHDGWRLVWISGHADLDPFGEPRLRTDGGPDEKPHGPSMAHLWRLLDRWAKRGSHPLIAIVCTCHAAPAERSAWHPHGNLVAFARCGPDQRAATERTGAWFTRAFADALDAGRSTLADVAAFLVDAAATRGDHKPVIVLGDHEEKLLVPKGYACISGDLVAYRRAVAERHLRAVFFKVGAVDKRDAWVDQVYVQVQLDSHGDRLHEHTLRDLLEQSQVHDLDPPALDNILAGGNRVLKVRRWLVVGHPGAGKSTLARRLTRETANRADGPVPLFISLPYWARNPQLSVVDIAAEVVAGDRTATKAALIQALRMGPAWLLFDGYDEVPNDDGAGRNPRAELSARLRSLAEDEAFAGTRIVVFSRPIDLQEIAKSYQRADLQRLSPPRQKELLAKWLAPDEVESLLEFTRTDGIRLQSELGNPLMLTLLAFVAIGRRREPEPWPQDVGELFGHALKLLMERGHTEGRPALPDPKLTRVLAQKLALHLHIAGGDAWPEADLWAIVDRLDLLSGHDEKWSDSRAFLLDLADDRGLFDYHHDDGLWRFRHRAFQERLAAEALKDQPKEALRLVKAAPAQWAEVYATTLALRGGDPSDGLRKLLKSTGKDVFLRVLPQARLRPARAIALLQEVNEWDGDDLLRLTRVWARNYSAETVRAAVLSLLPGPNVETRAYLWYALEEADIALERKAFFDRTPHTASPPALPWVDIPAGEFLMGSPDGEGRSNETPQRWVRISAFRMLETPVTFAQYRAFDPHHRQQSFGKNPAAELTNPANNTSWWAAYLFARWCGAVLPTEAQWEYACRANSTTRWSHGDHKAKLREFAWHGEGGDARTHAVRLKEPNQFRLFDMHGNVWEWCHDWFGYRPANLFPSTETMEFDPTGPSEGVRRVARGGSAWDVSAHCRSAYCDLNLPGTQWQYLGFRLASPLPG